MMKKKLMLMVVGVVVIIILLTVEIIKEYQGLDSDKELTEEVPKEIIYSNVWIIESDDYTIKAYVDNEIHTFETQYELTQELQGVIGDLIVEDDKVIKIAIKPDKISGKVLSYTDKYIEIEDYGKININQDYKIYKIYDELMEEMSSGILIGYSSTDFIVSNGEICAAIIKEEATPKNIRVLLKNNNQNNVFHDVVKFTSPKDYTVHYGDDVKEYKAGQIITIKENSKMLKHGRMILEPKEKDSKMQLLSLTRANGNPEYRGKIEIRKNKEGLTIVNDLSIEEYLYSVLPSEMPASYGLEALEVQAVCARSYAYTQLTNRSYGEYGAHVDDSVSYQVYNNIGEYKLTTQAVNETRGLVMEYGGNIISAYYFSTSAGHTSSAVDVWMGDQQIPYLEGKLQTIDEKIQLDLTKEKSFREFIKKNDVKTYDSEYAWYRWKVTIDAKDLKRVIDKNLMARYKANPDLIQTLQKDKTYLSVPIDTVGDVKKIRVTNRATGGIITEIVIEGNKNTIKVQTEYNIRTLLAPLYSTVTRQDKSKIDRLSMLPSAFIIIDHTENEKTLESITITGGGYGHGVGMSQNGVKAMVEHGKTYEEILKHYYPGVNIVMKGQAN